MSHSPKQLPPCDHDECGPGPCRGSLPASAGSALERLADILEMPADHVREAAEEIRRKRNIETLMAKVQLIRERNTAILPTGEIVARGTPGAMDYESPQNAGDHGRRTADPDQTGG